AILAALTEQLRVQGANPAAPGDARTEPAPADGVAPAGFCATTNLVTEVRVGGTWVGADRAEMDCVLVVGAGSPPAVRTTPLHRLRAGDAVVVGADGVRVHAPERPPGLGPFEFMGSEVSTEKPKATQLRLLADRMRAAREEEGPILAVCGP